MRNFFAIAIAAFGLWAGAADLKISSLPYFPEADWHSTDLLIINDESAVATKKTTVDDLDVRYLGPIRGSTAGYYFIAQGGSSVGVWQSPSNTLQAILPAQTGQSGKFLQTNGSTTGWAAVNSAIWGNISGTLSDQTDLNTALGLLAPLASPTFTGTLQSPSISDNGSQVFFYTIDDYGGVHYESRTGTGESSFSIEPGFGNIGAAGQWIFYTNGSGLNSQNDFAFYDSQLGAPVMILQSATGFMGLGQNDPSYQLEVNGAFSLDDMAAPSVSKPSSAAIYFDSTSKLLMASQSGGPYVPLVGFVPASPVTIKYFTTAYGTVCSNSSCDVTTNTTGVTVSRSTTGIYQVNFPAGLFSSPPACSFYVNQSANSGVVANNVSDTLPTTTTYNFHTVLVGVAYQDTYGDIICSSGNTTSIVNSLQGDTSFTPYTLAITGTSSNPSIGTTSVNQISWRRVDDSADIILQLTWTGAGGAGSGTYLFNLPPGLSVDTTKVTCGSPQLTLGSGTIYGVGSDMYATTVYCYDSTHLAMQDIYGTGSNSPVGSGALPLSNGTGSYTFTAKVPISGWASNQRAPTLNGSVTSTSAGAEILTRIKFYTTSYGTVCSASTCGITSDDPSTTVTRSGTGVYQINFASGKFSSPPTCTFVISTSGTNTDTVNLMSVSTTAYSFQVHDTVTYTAADVYSDIICMGPH